MSTGLAQYDPLGQLASNTQPTSPANGYDVTAANAPGLIEAFFADGISGNNLAGILGHVTLINSAGWTNLGNGQFRRVTGTASVSGTWPAIGTLNALLMMTGLFPTQADAIANVVRLGASAGTKLQNGSGVSVSVAQLTSSSNIATGIPTTIVGATKASATKLDQSTANGHIYSYWVAVDNSTEGPVVEDTLVGDISGTWSAFSTSGADYSLTAQTTPRYTTGIWLFAFNDFPNDAEILASMKFMADNPKRLPPAFYKRS